MEMITVTLASEIKSFIANYVMTDKLQQHSGYEDSLERCIDKLFSLCTTDEEREIVKAIISLEEH
jgi:hypothetical protein